ncbi:MAG TPA: VOC family protein [Pantanalinema sp.]
MIKSVTPFLMFQGNLEEAINFYVSVFPGAEVAVIDRFGAELPEREGKVMRANLSFAGQTFMVFDSPVKHAFSFTPAFSIFIECESEDEVRRLYEALSDGGSPLMPLGAYDFSRQFGWVNDRFGVSWQVILV